MTPTRNPTGTRARASGLGSRPKRAVTSRTNTTDKRLFVAAHKMSPATMSATEHGVARIASVRVLLGHPGERAEGRLE